MTIHSLDDAKDIKGLYQLLQTPGEAKVANGWFGRTIVIGDIKFSESSLFGKLTQIYRRIKFFGCPEGPEEWKKAGLCARRVIEIWNNVEECSLVKRLFQKIF